MKRTSWKIKPTKSLRRTKLRVVGDNPIAQIKTDIQALLREIVMLRDDGCIFKKEAGHFCTGFANDGHLILQADHLLSRAHNATFADHRLVVCVCKGIHGWKSVGSNLRKKEYDERVKKLLPPETVKLWDRCEREKYRVSKMDWNLEKLALQAELNRLKKLSTR